MSAMSESFHMIRTNGSVGNVVDAVIGYRMAHGSQKGNQFTIKIDNFSALWLDPESGACLVRFEKHQRVHEPNSEPVETARACTALLQHKEGAPLGLEWIHTHKRGYPVR